VDAALGLRDRHPLDPVGAALVLHPVPHVLALEQEGDLVEPAHVRGVGAQHLQLPAPALGVPGVHLMQVLGEEVGLLPALGAPDLHDDVAGVVGVPRQEQDLELLVDAGECGLGLVDQPLDERPVLAGGLAQHLLGRLQVARRRPVLPEGQDDRLQLLHPPRQGDVGALVGEDVGVRQADEDVLVLVLEACQTFEHQGPG
jgi:hypothetical protein